MKTLLPITIIAVIVFCVEACGKKAGAGDADIRIEFETRTDSIGYRVLHSDLADTVYAAAKYSIVWPEKIGEEDFQTLRDKLLQMTFDTAGVSVDKAADYFLTKPLHEIDGDSLAIAKVPYPIAADAMNATYAQVESEVTLLNPQLLVIRATSYVYFYGAAHGGQNVEYLNYSLDDHKILTADNIFTEGSKTAILDLINEAVKEAYPPEALFNERISDFSTLEISDSDIVFVYQQYEVAPYSTGIVRVPVSQYDLYRFFTPLAKQALGL